MLRFVDRSQIFGVTSRAVLTLVSIAFLSACSKESFKSVPDPNAATEALCGTGPFESNSPGPKITSLQTNQLVGLTATLSGTCSGTQPVTITGGGLTNPITTACTNGAFSQAVSFASGDGLKDLSVTQGTNGTPGKLCVLLNTVPPLVTITAPVEGTAARSGLTVSGVCTAGLDVHLAGAGNSASSTIPCTDGTFSAAVVFTAGDGTKPVSAAQTDTLGNTGVSNRNYLKNNMAPTIRITGPAAGTLTNSSIALVGTCTNGIPVMLAGDVIGLQANCVNGQFAASVALLGMDGSKNIVATQTDPIGNTASDTRSFALDSTPPAIRITGPATGQLTRGGVTITGTCETGLNVAISGDISATSSTTCVNGQFSAAVTLNTPDSSKNVVVSQTDAAGNIGSDHRAFVLDTTAPVITIAAPAVNSSSQGTITLTGTCENGLTVSISGAATPTTTTCSNGTYSTSVTLTSPDGTKNVIASQTDSVGNVGSANRNFVRDTTAPAISITGPAAGTQTQSNLVLTGTCENGLSVNVAGSGVANPGSVNCTNGQFSTPITLTTPDGTKNVTVSQTDGAGNTGSANQNFTRNTQPPAIAITGPAAGTVSRSTIALVGTCTSNYTVNLSGPGAITPTTAACVAGAFSATVTLIGVDGTKNVTATQTDSIGNTGTASSSFVLDTTAPAIAITSPDVGTVTQGTLTLGGTCESGLIVSISGAVQATTTACTGGTFSTAITLTSPDGTKNVVASQTDVAGNVGTANRNFVRDTTGPAITITGPAAGTQTQSNLTLTGTCENGLPITVGGTGLANPGTISCSNGQFSTPITLTTPDGVKNITVSQTDSVGNTGTASQNFTRNTQAPAISITGPAAGTQTRSTIAITGTCTSNYTVNLSGPGAITPTTTACVSGAFSATITLIGADGTKNVTATQTDSIGNTGSASSSFVLDTTAPAVTITGPAAGSVSQGTLTLTGTCENGLAVSISGGATPTSTACTNGTFSTAISLTTPDGTKNVVASQTDAAGNIGSANQNFVRDTTAPAITITGPAAGTQTQSGLVLTGTCENGLPITVGGSGLANPGTINCSNGQFSTSITLTTPDGVKNVTVSQTDGAGNQGTASQNFTRNTQAPAIAITGPAAGTITRSTIALVGTCTTGITVNLSGAITPATANCVAGAFSATITLTGADGTKNVTATQTDSIGNTGSASSSFVLDTTAPAVTITGPAANSASQGTLTLTGTCENGLAVSISGGATPTSTACTNGAFSTPITLTSPDGTKNVVASQTDAAGNVGSANQNFVRDTTAPAITITGPAAGTQTQSSLVLTGACENGLPITVGGTGIANPGTITCSNGQYSTTITLTSPDGSKNVTVSQTDTVGNTGTASRNFTRNTQPPSISITGPIAGTQTRSTIALVGTCTTGISVVLTGDITPTSATCSFGAFNATITLTGADGSKNVIATQTDSIGNTASASSSFVLDTVAPAITITGPAANSISQGSITLTGTCENGITIAISGAVQATNATCTNGTFSAPVTLTSPDGTKNVVATQTDIAGNVGSANRSFIRDTTAPAITITGPAAGTQTQSGLVLTGTCENGLSINVGGTGLANPGTVNCTNGQYSTSITLTSPDGVKNVTVSQTDAAGNTGTASQNFTRNTQPPAIAITGPAAGTQTRSTIAINGTCTSNYTVNLTGGITPATAACVSGAFSATITLTGADGTKNVTATQTDSIGNTGSASSSFVLDTTAPAIAITGPAAGTVTQGSLTLVGTCENGLTINVSGSVPTSTATCSGGQFSIPLTFTSPNGNKNVVVSQTDAAGNQGSDNRSFSLSLPLSPIAITGPAAGTVAQNGVTLTGTCNTGYTVTISGGVSASSQANCTNGQFSAPIVFSSGDGTKNVVVSQTDVIGNVVSDNRGFTRDSTPPALTITSPTNGSTLNSTNLTLTGSCEAGLNLTLSGNFTGGGTSACPAGGTYSIPLVSSVSNGTLNVTASQTDAVGNNTTIANTYQVSVVNSTTETFTSNQVQGKVDLLVIDDNSSSMEVNEGSLGNKFPSLVSALQSVDWQIGITTTDCSTDQWGICGSLLTMSGTNTNILTSTVPNYATVFSNTIVRPETVGCTARGNCPSGDSVPLKATLNAMQKASTANAGFFRADADLAVLILTNADEDDAAPIASSTTPQQVINQFSTLAGNSGKMLRVYTIGVLNGDSSCLLSQEQTGIAAYATYPIQLTGKTGGIAVSICAPDYSVTLQQIGADLKSATSNVVTLAHTPTAGTVQVTLTPNQNIPWTLSGNTITFSAGIPAGTQISVTYQY